MEDYFIEWAGRGYANAVPRIVRAADEKDAIRVLVASFGWTNVRLYRGRPPYGSAIRYHVDHCYGLHALLTGERDPHPSWVKGAAAARNQPVRCERETLDIWPAWVMDDWHRKQARRESRKALRTA